MKRLIKYAIIFKMLLLPSAQAWGFAFLTFENNRLVASDRAVPVVWPSQTVDMGISLSQFYSAYVVDAMSEWNSTGASVTVQQAQTTASPCSNGDGFNSISFTSDTCGQPWGEGVIGLTLVRAAIDPQGNYITEADVMIRSFSSEPTNHWATPDDANNSPSSSCYTNTQKGITCDFRRVVLHEIGHALGLRHPDELGQNVTAVMNSGSSASNITPPHLAADDINGIRAIYAGDHSIVDGDGGTQGGGASVSKSNSGGGSAVVDGALLFTLSLFLFGLLARRDRLR